jgi:large subunit ribosomal protein L28
MANTCAITGKGTKMAGGYSNRTRATKFNPTGKVRRKPNLQKKTFYVSEIDKKVTVTVSTEGLKTMKKNGVYETLKKAKVVK